MQSNQTRQKLQVYDKELSEYERFGELVMLSSDIQADGVLDQLPYLRKGCRK